MTRLSLLLAVALLGCASKRLAAEPAANLSRFKTDVQPLLARLCADCHGPRQHKGDLRLDTLSPDLLRGGDAETWHDVLNRINLGEMPPPKSPQPTSDERRAVVQWLTAELRKSAEVRRYAGGRVVMRRLTRYEYQNTMRDLLGVDLDFARDLPPEPPSTDGFLNNGATLEMSPVQLEAYLNAARAGLNEAIVSGDEPEIHRIQQEQTAVGKLPNRKVAGHEPANPEFLLDIKTFPRRGRFEIRIRAGAVIPAGHDIPRLRVALGCVPGIIHVPRKLVGEVDVTGGVDEPQTFIFRGRTEDFPQPGDTPFGNVDFDGMVLLIDFLDADGKELRYADQTYAALPQKKKVKKGKGKKKTEEVEPPVEAPVPIGSRLDIVIHSVEFEAPHFESWPPPSHTRILPTSDDPQDEPQYVRQVLRPFMGRAFRRPVDDEEVNQFARLFERIRSQSPTFEEALRETLASVLVSPHFLYIVETREEGANGQRLNEFELAARLSYFLWSSLPDEELFNLARQGKLSDPVMLARQVGRMLEDERSRALVVNLANQWFDLDGLERVAVNPEFHPDFDNQLKQHMRSETREYLGRILKENLSCLDLLDSNWAMLNRPLAQHYGIEGPRSLQFERVTLKGEDHRGGLLGQGSFC